MRIESRTLELVAEYIEATGKAREEEGRAERAKSRLEYLREWKRAGATLFGSRSCPESSWRYVAAFPVAAVPALAVQELAQLASGEATRDDCVYLEEWVENLPVRGPYSGGPGRAFCHGPSVYRRGSRVVVTEAGGLDI